MKVVHFYRNVALMSRLIPTLYGSVIFVTIQSKVSSRDVMLCILAYTDILEEPVVPVITVD